MEEFLRGVASAASPAVAALHEYQDRVKQLNLARSVIGEAEYNKQILAAKFAYEEAAKGATTFKTEVDAIKNALDPARAAQEAYNEAVRTAEKAVAGGAGREEATEWLRRQAVELQKVRELTALEADAVGKLKAMYDPLVKMERERAKALIEAKAAINEVSASEAERAAALAEVTRQIDIQYEKQRRLLELENNGLTELIAKYDPLVKVELERARAMIEMESVIAQANISEAERIELAKQYGDVINDIYDKQARAVTGNITLIDAWQNAWESAIQQIESNFLQLWEKGIGSFKDFTEQLKDTFKKVLAQIAHMMITKPLIMKVGVILTGQPQAGQFPGSGTVLDRIKDLLAGGTGQKKPMDTPEGAAKAVATGTQAAYGGQNPATASATAMQTAFPDLVGLQAFLAGQFQYLASALCACSRDVSSGVSDADAYNKIAEAVQDTMFGPGSVGDVINTQGGSAADMAAETVGGQLSSATGGSNPLGNIGTINKVLGKLSTQFAAFSTAFSTNFMGYIQGAWMNASQIGAAAGAGAGGAGAAAGQIAGSAAYGLGSGFVVDQLLGSRGDPTRNMAFSAVGGIIGNFILPGIGALVGGAIGSFVDNLFGGSKSLEKFTLNVEAQGDALKAWTYTKIKTAEFGFRNSYQRTTEDVDSTLYETLASSLHTVQQGLRAVAEALEVSTDAIDNFSSKLEINLKGVSNEDAQKRIEQGVLNMAGEQIMKFVTQTEGLSDRFKILVAYYRNYTRDFVEGGSGASSQTGRLGMLATLLQRALETSGNAPSEGSKLGTGDFPKEFFAVFETLSKLEGAMSLSASEGGQKIVDEGTKTLTEKYKDLSDATVELAENFDGTITYLNTLTEAYVTQKQAAWELAAALKSVETEIGKMFADTAESIRMSLMEPEELYEYRKAQAENLAGLLTQTTDPGELARLSEEINNIVNSLYGGLDETQRQTMAPEFLEFLSGVDAIVRGQVATGLEGLDDIAQQADNDITNSLLSTVLTLDETTERYAAELGVFTDGANTFSVAVDRFAAIVSNLLNNQSPAPIATAPSGYTSATSSTATRGSYTMSGFSSGGREVNA
jgi:ribosomal protein S11